MIKMTKAEWLELGKKLFGPDLMDWRFVCPACKHVAAPRDFKKFKSAGATPDSATCECIGRYLPKEQRGGWSSDHANQKIKAPCDYAGYGLFRLSPLLVIGDDGAKRHSFDFDRSHTLSSASK